MGEPGMSALRAATRERLRSRPRAAVAAPQRVAVGVGNHLRAAAGAVPRLPEGVYGSGTVGRSQPTEYQIAMLYFVAGKLEIPYYG